jgi:hypothetical protein
MGFVRSRWNGIVLIAPICSLLACSSSGGTGPCNDLTTPTSLSAQQIGDPCRANEDCNAGLTCESAYLAGGEITAQNACSIDCRTASCPAGSVCVDGEGSVPVDGGFERKRLCLPSCTSDNDCVQGTRAGTCVVADGGASVCHPITCYAGRCPTGYGCTGAFCPSPGSEAPMIPGWCLRR